MRARASEDLEARLGPALRAGSRPSDGTRADGTRADGTRADGTRADGTDALVALAVDLRDAARPVAGVLPRQEFRAALAERLADQARELEPARRAAAERARAAARRTGAVGTAVDRPHRVPRRVRTVAAGLVAVVVAGGAGAAVASENALPGGLLYPLKRQVEELRLSLSSPGQARGGTELALARERLVEAEELALASGGADVPATDTPQLRATLDDFGASALAGITALTDDYAETGDARSLAAVNTFLDETVPLLQRLRAMTPPSVHPVIDQLLADLGTRRTELADIVASCAACRDLDLVVAVPEVDPTPSVVPTGSVTGPDGTVTAVPTLPGATTGGSGTGGGGALDPLDPLLDDLPLDPSESVVDELLPSPDPTRPLPLPTALPPVLPTSLPTVPPVTLPGATLPVVTLPPVTVSAPPLLPPPSSPVCLPVVGCP